MCQQQTNLLQNRPGGKLTKPNQKLRKRPRTLRILRTKALPRNLPQNLVSKLRIIELLSEHGKTLRHGFGEMLVVLEGLHYANLCREGVVVVFDS
jgi:hypothetical protein